MKAIGGLLGFCPIITGLSAIILLVCACQCQAQSALVLANLNPQVFGLPTDLRVVLPEELPEDAVWLSLQHWQDWPPLPANWCADRTDVCYYMSASLGPRKVFVDDPAQESPFGGMTMALDLPPFPGDGGSQDGSGDGTGGGPLLRLWPPLGYQPGDIWLEIFPDTNYVG